MARILLGWELGANRGHLLRLAKIARWLTAQGHQVDAALQNVDGAAVVFPEGTRIWQAPLWPRLMANVARLDGPPVATMGDILARLGLDRGEAFEGLIRAWDSLFGAIAPDMVIGDFAPALLRAAWGRIPSIAVGTGFECVPHDLPAFPGLNGLTAAHDEAAMLDQTNAALLRCGRPTMDNLPALFTADTTLAATFRELDPYAALRKTAPISPTIEGGAPPISEGRGEEIFVYGFAAIMADAPLWDGLAQSGLKVRVHVPRASPMLREKLLRLSFAVEDKPLPFTQIAESARLVVSHGGHGFTSSALLAGIPHIVTPFDLEKRINADRVVSMQLGGQVALTAIRPAPFAESLKRIHADDGFGARARAAAPGFHTQMGNPIEAAILHAIQKEA